MSGQSRITHQRRVVCLCNESIALCILLFNQYWSSINKAISKYTVNVSSQCNMKSPFPPWYGDGWVETAHDGAVRKVIAAVTLNIVDIWWWQGRELSHSGRQRLVRRQRQQQQRQACGELTIDAIMISDGAIPSIELTIARWKFA